MILMCLERRILATSFPIPRWRASGTRGPPSSAQPTRNVASVNCKTNLKNATPVATNQAKRGFYGTPFHRVLKPGG